MVFSRARGIPQRRKAGKNPGDTEYISNRQLTEDEEYIELRLERVTKRYGNTWGLRVVSASFTPGIYGLLGPNGAGKSTLIKLIVRNLYPDKGEILCNGVNIADRKDYPGLIGYVPQQQGLYETFTGRRFLLYIAALKGLDRETTLYQMEKYTKMVNMQDHLDKRMKAYSGGMRQRILIAQALLGEPKIIILDEPTAGLDPKERIRIRSLISELSENRIVIYATHVVSDIESIAKEIILLDRGRMLQKAAPSEMLSSMSGQVWHIFCERRELDRIQQDFLTGSIQERTDKRLCVRVLSDTRPEGWDCEAAQPTLEDVYLKTYGSRG